MQYSHETYFLGTKALAEMNMRMRRISEQMMIAVVGRSPETASAVLEQVECMIGCMIETSISVAAAVHVNGGEQVSAAGVSQDHHPHAALAESLWHTANALRSHAGASLLISAHDEQSHVQPLLYQSALQHLLDLIFVLLCEKGEGRLKRLSVNLARRQNILEP